MGGMQTRGQRRIAEGFAIRGDGIPAGVASTPVLTPMPTPLEQQMSKRAKMTVLEARTSMMETGSIFKLVVNYEEAKLLSIGKYVPSNVICVGGHLWRFDCFPRGVSEAGKGQYVSLFLTRMNTSGSVKVTLEASLEGQPPQTDIYKKLSHEFSVTSGNAWGWFKFAQRTDLEKNYITKGHITFVCSISVSHCPVPVPPSDIGVHLGSLLDTKGGADVSFTIEGETFSVHRAVLAACSPVFRAELFGSMAEASMPSITLQDITLATFKAMLRFMYTDAMPGDKELGDAPVEMLQDLLAAADRYALDRLKLMCVEKLWDNISIDAVATILACAETYGCLELKNKCLEFFAVEDNFMKVVFTSGYAMLLLKCPTIATELSKRVIP